MGSIRTILLFIISVETQHRYDGYHLQVRRGGGTYEIADALIGFPSELKNPFSASLADAASQPPDPILVSERREKRRMKSEVLSQVKRGPVPDMARVSLVTVCCVSDRGR